MLNSLIKITKKKHLFPFYHLVENEIPVFIKHLYTPKNIKNFKSDLDTFLQYFESISLSQTIATNIHSGSEKKASFHVTFDDGLSNFYHVIAPILLEKKIHATVFLNSDFIDNKDLFYRYKASLLIEQYLNSDKEKQKKIEYFVLQHSKNTDVKNFLLQIDYQNRALLDSLAHEINYSFTDYLNKHKPYLTSKQITELQKQGFTFGSHSKSHPLYQKLSLFQQIYQTIEDLNELKKHQNITYPVFAFPFYDTNISTDFFNAIQDKITLSFGTSGLKKDTVPWNLQRLDMEKNKGNTKLFLIKQYFKLFLQQQTNKNNVKRS